MDYEPQEYDAMSEMFDEEYAKDISNFISIRKRN